MDVDPVKNPNSAECIRCGKCVASCPKESLALKFVYGKKG
ncbi:4Fe-4S dicluster domain-containing protein [Dorea formicigenerans]